MDRLLNDHNGESYFNDEDDAMEGRDGIFDLFFADAIDAMGSSYVLDGPDKETLEKLLLDV